MYWGGVPPQPDVAGPGSATADHFVPLFKVPLTGPERRSEGSGRSARVVGGLAIVERGTSTGAALAAIGASRLKANAAAKAGRK